MSGDGDLLALEGFGGISIVTAATFIAQFDQVRSNIDVRGVSGSHWGDSRRSAPLQSASVYPSNRALCIRPGGGRTWWAHFEFTRINIDTPIILRKKIEELRETRACVSVYVEHRGAGSRSAGFLVQGCDTCKRFGGDQDQRVYAPSNVVVVRMQVPGGRRQASVDSGAGVA